MSIAAIGISASVLVRAEQQSTPAAPSVAATGAVPADAVSISAAGQDSSGTINAASHQPCQRAFSSLR